MTQINQLPVITAHHAEIAVIFCDMGSGPGVELSERTERVIAWRIGLTEAWPVFADFEANTASGVMVFIGHGEVKLQRLGGNIGPMTLEEAREHAWAYFYRRKRHADQARRRE